MDLYCENRIKRTNLACTQPAASLFCDLRKLWSRIVSFVYCWVGVLGSLWGGVVCVRVCTHKSAEPALVPDRCLECLCPEQGLPALGMYTS